MERVGVFQILNDLLDYCESRISTLPLQGEETIRTNGDYVDGRDRSVIKLGGLISVMQYGANT